MTTPHDSSLARFGTDLGPIVVAGGTGFVGKALVRELLSRGAAVRVIARDAAMAADAFATGSGSAGTGKAVSLPTGLDILTGDLLSDDHARAAWADGAGAAVNLIGIIREGVGGAGGQTFDRVHRGAARTIVRTLENAGVARYLHMSALGVRSGGVCEYQRSKWDAELTVRKCSLDWTIFRPGLIHGPEGDFIKMARDWCQGKASPWFFLPYFTRPIVPKFEDSKPIPKVIETPMVQPVFVGDVANAFADALNTKEASHEVYTLVGPERLSWPEMLTAISEALPLSRDLRPIGIPGQLAALGAVKAKFLGMGDLLPFDYGMAMMGMEDTTADPIKTRAHLPTQTRAFRPMLKTYASSL